MVIQIVDNEEAERSLGERLRDLREELEIAEQALESLEEPELKTPDRPKTLRVSDLNLPQIQMDLARSFGEAMAFPDFANELIQTLREGLREYLDVLDAFESGEISDENLQAAQAAFLEGMKELSAAFDRLKTIEERLPVEAFLNDLKQGLFPEGLQVLHEKMNEDTELTEACKALIDEKGSFSANMAPKLRRFFIHSLLTGRRSLQPDDLRALLGSNDEPNVEVFKGYEEDIASYSNPVLNLAGEVHIVLFDGVAAVALENVGFARRRVAAAGVTLLNQEVIQQWNADCTAAQEAHAASLDRYEAEKRGLTERITNLERQIQAAERELAIEGRLSGLLEQLEGIYLAQFAAFEAARDERLSRSGTGEHKRRVNADLSQKEAGFLCAILDPEGDGSNFNFLASWRLFIESGLERVGDDLAAEAVKYRGLVADVDNALLLGDGASEIYLALNQRRYLLMRFIEWYFSYKGIPQSEDDQFFLGRLGERSAEALRELYLPNTAVARAVEAGEAARPDDNNLDLEAIVDAIAKHLGTDVLSDAEGNKADLVSVILSELYAIYNVLHHKPSEEEPYAGLHQRITELFKRLPDDVQPGFSNPAGEALSALTNGLRSRGEGSSAPVDSSAIAKAILDSRIPNPDQGVPGDDVTVRDAIVQALGAQQASLRAASSTRAARQGAMAAFKQIFQGGESGEGEEALFTLAVRGAAQEGFETAAGSLVSINRFLTAAVLIGIPLAGVLGYQLNGQSTGADAAHMESSARYYPGEIPDGTTREMKQLTAREGFGVLAFRCKKGEAKDFAAFTTTEDGTLVRGESTVTLAVTVGGTTTHILSRATSEIVGDTCVVGRNTPDGYYMVPVK